MKKLLSVIAVMLVASVALATKASLDLKVEGDKLWAYVLVDGNADGTVAVEWTAPADSFCANSTKDLAYKATGAWHTKANRTLINPVKGTDCVATCSGVWTVVVKEGDAVLTTKTIEIGKDGKVVEPKVEKVEKADKKKKK